MADSPFVKRLNRSIGDYLFDPTTVYLTSSTGGKKGSKVCSYKSIPWEPLAELAAVYGMGAMKYPDEDGAPNYMKGMPFSWHLDAMERHIAQFKSGINFDPDSGLHVLAHAAWYPFTLMTYQARNLGMDDRINRVGE